MPFAALTAVLLLLQSISIAERQAQPQATIQGVVTSIATNEPIVGAQVILTRVNPTAATAGLPPIPPVTSGRDGRFEIGSLDAGVYRLAVMNNGYVREEYSQRVNGVSTASITLSTGQALNDLMIRMTKAGNISGRVRSTTGAPVAGVPVELLRRTYTSTGTQAFQSAGRVQTNDLGEYRLYWVTPGRYQIAAGGGSGAGSMGVGNDADTFDQRAIRGTNAVRTNYSQVFFPGVSSPERAETIDIQAGAEVAGIDFSVSRQRLYRIRARVVDSRTGQPPPQASVSLSTQSRTGGGGTSFSGRLYDASKGMVQIDDLVPGAYGIRVTAQDLGVQTLANITGTNTGTPQAYALVVIRDSDIDDLVLTIVPPPVITGRLKVEGFKIESLRIQLRPADSTIPGISSSTVAPSLPGVEGTFTLYGVLSAEFRVTANTPVGVYLKDARLNGVDVLTRSSLFSGSGELDVVISSRVGRLQGRVTDERLQPIAGIQAVLVPDNARERNELFKTGTTDAAGRFAISGIAPGAYKLFAWESIEPFSYFDPEVLKKFELNGRPVQVADSSDETVELKIISAGGAQ